MSDYKYEIGDIVELRRNDTNGLTPKGMIWGFTKPPDVSLYPECCYYDVRWMNGTSMNDGGFREESLIKIG